MLERDTNRVAITALQSNLATTIVDRNSASSSSSAKEVAGREENWKRALNEYDAYKQEQGLDPSLRKGLLRWINMEIAQQIMERLQSELDSSSQETYRKRCFSLLWYLSRKHPVVPSSLLVKEVKRDHVNAVAGGGFSDIYRGTVNGETVCLKVLRLSIEPDEGVRTETRKQFCREALIWRQLRHPNILPLLGVHTELFFPSFCLISPWMANKDIITYLKQNPKHDISSVLSDIVAGIGYLHSRDPPIVHGDIRGANILVTDDLHCCLADFGLADVIAHSQAWSITSAIGNKPGALRWLAPEYIALEDQAVQSVSHTSRDIYALGCTVVEILTRQPPFSGCKNDASVLFSLMKGKRPLRPQNCSDLLWNLVSRCWAEEEKSRPSIQEISEILEATTALPPLASTDRQLFDQHTSKAFLSVLPSKDVPQPHYNRRTRLPPKVDYADDVPEPVYSNPPVFRLVITGPS